MLCWMQAMLLKRLVCLPQIFAAVQLVGVFLCQVAQQLQLISPDWRIEDSQSPAGQQR
jgi:hypothetical protein